MSLESNSIFDAYHLQFGLLCFLLILLLILFILIQHVAVSLISFTNYTDIFGNFRTGWMALSTPVAYFFYKYVTTCIEGIVGSFHVWPFSRHVEHSVGWNCASVTIVWYNVFCQLFYLTGMVLISLFNQRQMSCQALLEVVIRISDIINYAHIRSSLS